MSNLADYRTAVRMRGYDGMGDATIDAAIQDARRRVFNDHRWSFLRQTANTSTTIGASTLPLTSLPELAYLESVRLRANGIPMPLDWRPEQIIRDLPVSTNETGMPRFWNCINTTLTLYPIPDATYLLNIDYVRAPGDLAGSDEDDIPDRLRDLVVWAATIPLSFRQRDLSAASAADQLYSKVYLPRAVSQETTEQRQTSRQIRSGYWE